jgi:hypothetical protein
MRTAITPKEPAIWMMVLLAALLISPTPPTQAADSHVEGTMIFSPVEELTVPLRGVAVMAPGSAEDTLKACIARIPEFASVGQRMLAEQSCASEEETRKAIRSAPKF